MLTELNKREIYNFLSKKLDFNVPYALAEVGKELTISGYGCRRYGFSRMKNMMNELTEFIELEDYEYSGHSNTNVTLKEWQQGRSSDEGGVIWAPTSSEMAEWENEMGTGLISLMRGQPNARVKTSETKASSKPAAGLKTEENREVPVSRRRQDVVAFSDVEKEKIYQILCGRFPKMEKLHMAKISKYLVERGFSPKNYGYSKMKSLLQDMGQYLELEDVIISNVPNVLVTILDRTTSGFGIKKPLKLTKTTQPEAGRNWMPSTRSIQKEEEPAKEIVTTQPEEPAEEKKEEYFERGKLSEFLRLTYLPPKIMDYLKRKGLRNPERVLASAYQHALEHHLVQVRSYSITFPLRCGEEDLIAVLKKNERPYGRQWYLSYVGSPKTEQEDEEEEKEEDLTIPPGKSLEQFADLGYWPDFLKELATLALPEKWDSSRRRYGRYYVLKKYVQYTFYRLLQEDKICISQDRKFAAFNTGLVNHHYDDIYACFVPNPQEGKEEWKFETFAMAGIRGKDGYGKLLTSYFNPLPQVPTYVENKEDLIYDLSKELLTDYEHIIIDNLRRLPKGYLREGCYGDEEALSLIDNLEQNYHSFEALRQIYAELSQYIADHDRIFRRLRSRMEDAIEMALKRVRWNYKTAIPSYFPKGNCMSLMLPLCLEDESHIDAALVVQKNPSGSYQGQTVLRLDQAYLDARLICRPNMDWLQNEEETNLSSQLLQNY